ncbi:hypothetical protein GJU39_13525 [Pedobacter petrophilus]|uniref:Uncharacterized protein n=1 Tax=Pedobacter petrophilus TaxID=1908241 RepID=A0A7K0FZT0_9SPHI|nr:hypothetical protein [Pedobacter petrophilus]MRX77107.1 hypothetical protein [Pedobacter petrophilus]
MSGENETIKIASDNQLIDLPVQGTAFNNKTKADAITHPKAMIRILTFSYPKNGLANLL